MIYVTAEQMRQIDHYTINEIGIPSIVLMENAKAQISKHILTINLPKRMCSHLLETTVEMAWQLQETFTTKKSM